MVKNLPVNAGNSGGSGDVGLIPGLGRFPRRGNGDPLQYSCLENPMDREPGGLQSIGLQRVGHNLETDHACISQFSSVQFSSSVVSNSLQPHGLQHGKPPCPSPTTRVYSNSCSLSQ